MSEAVEKEIEAIKAVLAALEPLSEQARRSVLDYVLKRLEISLAPAAPASVGLRGSAPSAAPLPTPAVPPGGMVHIATLKDEKKPRSANEMAALVAYYLSHLASPEQRKTTVTTEDLQTYFKIAKFPLPRQIRVTLQNATNAGYLDSAGEGEYKLNAVGYNLVVHNMPRGGDEGRGRRSKRPKKRKK